MTDPLYLLSSSELETLGSALRSGRLSFPFTAASTGHSVAARLATSVSCRLNELAASGMPAEHMAMILNAIVVGRTQATTSNSAIQLVWTGPDGDASENRDTAVVVRELFAAARESVLIAGYAVYQGRTVFRTLAEQMRSVPDLRVRLFLDIHDSVPEDTPFVERSRRFHARFRDYHWPAGYDLPEIYFDPRAFDRDPARRASLHAKCVVIDSQIALITSANFTEAAHERNIEAGVRVESAVFAAEVVEKFDRLIAEGFVTRLV